MSRGDALYYSCQNSPNVASAKKGSVTDKMATCILFVEKNTLVSQNNTNIIFKVTNPLFLIYFIHYSKSPNTNLSSTNAITTNLSYYAEPSGYYLQWAKDQQSINVSLTPICNYWNENAQCLNPICNHWNENAQCLPFCPMIDRLYGIFYQSVVKLSCIWIC